MMQGQQNVKFCKMCLWFDQFVFVAVVMVPIVYICDVCQALIFDSRGCASIFL
jgi:hypothetical protein